MSLPTDNCTELRYRHDGIDVVLRHFRSEATRATFGVWRRRPAPEFPAFIELHVAVNSNGGFYFKRQHMGDNWLMRLGLLEEVTLLDPELHNGFVVHCPYGPEARAYVQQPKVALALKKLTALGWTQISYDGQTLYATRAPYTQELDHSTETLVNQSLESIVNLAEPVAKYFARVDAKKFLPYYKSEQRFKAAGLATPVMFFFMLCLIVTICAWGIWAPLHTFTAVKATIIPSIGIPVLVLMVLRRRICQAYLSWKQISRFVLLPFMGIIVLSSGLIIWSNAHFDRSPIETHYAPILRKRVTQGRHRSRHLLTIQSWDNDPAETSVDLSVSRDEFERARPGVNTVKVNTKKGRFNLPWVVGYKVEAPAVPLDTDL